MRITFIGHASILIESGEVALLTDPWWTGPCFGAQWWIHPQPFLEVLENRKLTHIYISHGHNDHLHPGTLARFSRETKILAAKDLDIGPALEAMGFTVLQLPDGYTADLGSGVQATIRPTVGGDSLLTVADGKEVCVNLNDALHATPARIQDHFIAWLKKQHAVVDYLFCGYGTASHFPNCYLIPGKDYQATAARRQHHFNMQWARIVQELNPIFAFPFAADVALLEKELFWCNEPVHNSERPVQLLTQNGSPHRTQAFDMAPGFTIENGSIARRVERIRVSNRDLTALCGRQIERSNFYAEIAPAEVKEALPLLEKNIRICNDYLSTYPGNYKVLLQFRNSEYGISVEKSSRAIAANCVPVSSDDRQRYDLVFTTRLPYFKRSLDSTYGHEVMFVGSGCLFELPNRAMIARKLHEEAQCLVRSHDSCPRPRYGGSNAFTYKSKKIIKRMLGIEEADLYDLEQWTCFSNGS